MCRKVLYDQRDCLYPGLHIQNCSTAEIIFTSPKFSHTFPSPRKTSFLLYKKTQSRFLGCHFLLNYAERKKNQMSFCTLKSNCRPYNSFFFPLCNLYISFQWNTPSTNLLCMWKTASSALTLFLVNKETEFPIHKRTNHFIFWINESVIYLRKDDFLIGKSGCEVVVLNHFIASA